MSTKTESKKGGMEHFTEKVADVMTPIAAKLQSMAFISALSQAMQVLMPVIIIGSFACLIAFIDVFGWQAFLADHPSIQFICMTIQSLTLSLFAFYVLLALPYLYANALGLKEALATVPLAIATFLLLTPTELYTSVPTEWLGHKGLLSAMVVSFIVVRVVKFCIDKNIRIKMPAGVPKFVVDAFSVLIPAAFLIIVSAVTGNLLSKTSIGTFHNLIYTVLQIPFKKVGLSMIGSALTETAATLAMFCGLHPSTVVGIVDPLRNAANLENLEAWQAGIELPNIINGAFFTGLVSIGAGGSCLACTLSVLLFTKSKQYKNIGKVAIVPGIFGIGEPILFGLPIMLNPIFFIPFIGVTLFNNIFGYLIIAAGFIGKFTGVTVSWTTPPIVSPLLTSSTPVKAAIAQLVIIAIDLCIWYPFMKAADKIALEEEKELAAEEAKA